MPEFFEVSDQLDRSRTATAARRQSRLTVLLPTAIGAAVRRRAIDMALDHGADAHFERTSQTISLRWRSPRHVGWVLGLLVPPGT